MVTDGVAIHAATAELHSTRVKTPASPALRPWAALGRLPHRSRQEMFAANARELLLELQVPNPGCRIKRLWSVSRCQRIPYVSVKVIPHRNSKRSARVSARGRECSVNRRIIPFSASSATSEAKLDLQWIRRRVGHTQRETVHVCLGRAGTTRPGGLAHRFIMDHDAQPLGSVWQQEATLHDEHHPSLSFTCLNLARFYIEPHELQLATGSTASPDRFPRARPVTPAMVQSATVPQSGARGSARATQSNVAAMALQAPWRRPRAKVTAPLPIS